MRIFVTGAGGFVGSHVVRGALAAGHEVCALVRPGRPATRLAGLRSRVEMVEADIGDLSTVQAALEAWRPEACLHLAWYAEPGRYLHSAANVACLTQSLALLEGVAAAGCTRVTMVGTCAEYDTDIGYLREDGPTRPTTLYAATKLALGTVAAQRAPQLGMDVVWARLFYLYGPHENAERLVPALIRALMQGRTFPMTRGDQVRDYLHVADVASALLLLATTAPGGTFNVSTGTPVTVRSLAETVGALLDRPELIQLGALPYRDWEPPMICGDSRRLRQLGWSPRLSLHEGLRDTIAWWADVDPSRH